jgi:hypothetical protein
MTFDRVFDFGFNRYLTLRVVRVAYLITIVLAVVGTLLGLLGTCGILILSLASKDSDESRLPALGIAIGLLFGPTVFFLICRILLEWTVVFFRMAETLGQIRDKAPPPSRSAKWDAMVGPSYRAYEEAYRAYESERSEERRAAVEQARIAYGEKCYEYGVSMGPNGSTRHKTL